MIEDLWPLFRLRLRTGDLELRVPSDTDVAEVAALTREPIHDPALMPFFVPWTDEPEDVRVRATLQWHWRSRAEWKPEDWRLELVGYRPDGSETRERRGEPATLVRLLLTRSEWERLAPSWPSVTVEGLEACRAEFGLGPERPGDLPSGP